MHKTRESHSAQPEGQGGREGLENTIVCDRECRASVSARVRPCQPQISFGSPEFL